MFSPRLFATMALASFGFAFLNPALAAPQACPAEGDCITVAQSGRQDDRRYRDEERSRDRDRREHRETSRDRDRRDRDWDRERSRWRWEYERQHRWRTQRRPRHRHWVGRDLPPRGPYMVILDYRDYGLPRPRPGYAYVRMDRDVYLISEATRRIIDAFVLLEATGR